MGGVEAGEGTSEDLHEVAVATETVVHVPEVGVHVISIPTGTAEYTLHHRCGGEYECENVYTHSIVEIFTYIQQWRKLKFKAPDV